jgi:hypothetical protein
MRGETFVHSGNKALVPRLNISTCGYRREGLPDLWDVEAELRIATGDEWKLSALWPSETGELLVTAAQPLRTALRARYFHVPDSILALFALARAKEAVLHVPLEPDAPVVQDLVQRELEQLRAPVVMHAARVANVSAELAPAAAALGKVFDDVHLLASASCDELAARVDVLRSECVGPDLGIVLWLALWLSAALLQVYLARWLFKACMFAADVASVRAIHEKRIADLLNQEEARQGSRIV